jgi:trimethylamine--corrinoid protein Co-methyltransferase
LKRGAKGGIIKILSKKELRDIHVATIEVLEKVGMKSDSQTILDVFSKAGANVDNKEKLVKIPRYLVEEALKKAPNHIILCGRNPKNDILLEGSRVHFGMGGTPVPYIRDSDTGEFRRPTKKDFADATRIGDSLNRMDYIMGIAGAFDVPWELEYLHEFDALFHNTEKPIIYSAPSVEETKRVIEMASLIVGGTDELKKRPIFGNYCESVTPLYFTTGNENMITSAKASVPVILGPGAFCGGTGPATPAGSLVVSNAENLAAITLIQLSNPHAPVCHASWSNSMDPRTGVSLYGSPENMIAHAVNAQLAQYYDLPCFGTGGVTDSKAPDMQAGAEYALTSLLSAMAGENLIHDSGYLASGAAGSMEMAVISNEIAGYILHGMRGFKVDDETLAVDVIKSVGPGGNFLSHKHTLKHIRDVIYIPEIFERNTLNRWINLGKKDAIDTAHETVKKTLKEHWPEPLPKHVTEKMHEIINKPMKSQ